ncbi:hypothetical protein RRG08_044061 [Elysia crispata]|uniref:Uncharacterized protein n=1 Tax=Elysia crispata TaxID=231223 RepID=A0AAE1CRH1_9GAST|nr:hypothetical protein RRG08_044061 [Elysia crispata]
MNTVICYGPFRKTDSLEIYNHHSEIKIWKPRGTHHSNLIVLQRYGFNFAKGHRDSAGDQTGAWKTPCRDPVTQSSCYRLLLLDSKIFALLTSHPLEALPAAADVYNCFLNIHTARTTLTKEAAGTRAQMERQGKVQRSLASELRGTPSLVDNRKDVATGLLRPALRNSGTVGEEKVTT